MSTILFMVLSVFLTILFTIQNIILSYCHFVNVVTILHILSLALGHVEFQV